MTVVFNNVVAVALLISLAVGLIRVARGPTRADQLMAAQLLSTTGIAILVLLADNPEARSLHDVALFLCLLATVTSVAFVRLVWLPGHREEGGSQDD